MADYAFLNEIWMDPSTLKHDVPQCSLKNKTNSSKMDNIMDAYISEEKYTRGESDQIPIKKCIDTNAITGYEEQSSLLKYAYTLDSYYNDDIDNMKVKEEAPQINNVCEENMHPIYKDLVEKFDEPKEYFNLNYIELVIYILSGVFLIFFMEQILQLGKYMKK